MKKRIAVLTGGGDAPGLNAVIRAIVKTAIREYGYEVVGFRNGFRGVVERDMVLLTENDVAGILPRGGTILGTSNRDSPFKFPVGKDKYEDKSKQCIETILEYAEALISIGGDGSLMLSHKLFEMGLPVIGCPKTIDNDLKIGIAQTFGFESAYSFAAEALDRLHTTAESHHRIMCMEVMGRYAGWIALYAGIAGGADVILIPEIPFTYKKIIEKIEERKKMGKKFSLIIVAEGAKPEGGKLVVQKMVSASIDPVRLGGIGNVVASELEKMTGMETRATVLGHLQRGGSPTPYDRILSTMYGTAAMDLAAKKQYGYVVSLDSNCKIKPIPLAEAASGIRTVDVTGELVKTARKIGISFGD
ncbi:ATP-dependent 6-phosphofructokinase [Peptococcaceae bacterium]|nr:ATP-dependent 6-phosphofructokinase [Peptococcaceae bacterium]MCL0052350.1 ATP-dependent 6-phosphofructokinase [Peptococcaceae bacterium]MCL0062683.1 ATP-dependent 6-phosphofructokinase [Peptococcaceae bacterium]